MKLPASLLRMDELHMNWPSYGSRRLTVLLQREGVVINRKRVVRLMEEMGLEALYPKRSLSQPGVGHRIYPYLLEGLAITGPDQVWCSAITYVPMAQGFMYLVAIMDWWSRYVVGWELSNSLDSEFCIRAWNTVALGSARRWVGMKLFHALRIGAEFAFFRGPTARLHSSQAQRAGLVENFVENPEDWPGFG